MFSSVVFTALLAASSSLFVLADPTPTAPGPGDSFKEGSNCTFAWDGDTNAATKADWTVMNVELMSGSNLQMNHITTVASVDGTTTGTFSYACPEVTPNSAIYFYQFSSPNSSTLSWSTRFTIAGADGSTTPPANANQPDPATPAIPWGVGALVNPAEAVAAPKIGTSSAAGSATGAATTTTAAGGNSGAGSAAAPTTSGFVSTAVGTASGLPSATASKNASSSAITMSGSVFGSVMALGAAVALVY